MADNQEPLQVLSEARAKELLKTQRLGRVIERVGDIIEVFPVNYDTDGERIVFRTAPGTKLAGFIAAQEVLFEVDELIDAHAWSVVARGHARLIETDAELAELGSIKPQPLLPTVKEHIAVLEIDSISGREFTIGPEPEAEPETIA